MKTVILFSLCVGLASEGCSAERRSSADEFRPETVAPGVLQVGVIQHPAIQESSGVIGCRFDTNVFWTHNDGRRPVLYAITRSGKSVAEFPIVAFVHDWEDIANDHEGHLYLGDIGNNDAKRTQIAVHQIDEPNPKDSGKRILVNKTWLMRFPKKPFDCESLFIWQGHGYVISKVFKDQLAEIYRFPLAQQKESFVLEFVAQLPIDSPVTAADISVDGRRLAVMSKAGAWAFNIKGNVARAGEVKPRHTKFKHEQIEGCCFVPEGLLATAESREIYLFTDEHFRATKQKE
ncbi:MAG TPA: hypothetical protein VGK40_12365 [Verrucomicrobiae bacterium]|jgi:hypothetical protein